MAIIWCFITSHDAHLSYCAYRIVVCSVLNIMIRRLVFYQKQNVWTFNIMLSVTKSSGLRKLVLINGLVEKIVIIFLINLLKLFSFWNHCWFFHIFFWIFLRAIFCWSHVKPSATPTFSSMSFYPHWANFRELNHKKEGITSNCSKLPAVK